MGLHTRWEMTWVDKRPSASQDERLLHVVSSLVIWTTRSTTRHIKAYSPHHRCTYFPRIYEPPPNSLRQKSDKKHVPWQCEITDERKKPWPCEITEDRKEEAVTMKVTDHRKYEEVTMDVYWQQGGSRRDNVRLLMTGRKQPWQCKVTDGRKKATVTTEVYWQQEGCSHDNVRLLMTGRKQSWQCKVTDDRKEVAVTSVYWQQVGSSRDNVRLLMTGRK